MSDEKRERRTLSIRPIVREAGFSEESSGQPQGQSRSQSSVDHSAPVDIDASYRRTVPYTGELDALNYRDVFTLRLASIQGAYLRSDEDLFDEAEQMLRDNIARMDREIKHQLTALAKIQMKAGKLEEAEDTLTEALDIDNEDSRTLMALGNLYKTMGRYDDAIGKFEESLEVDPDDKFTHFDMGLTYLLMGENQLAAASFYEVIDIDAGDLKAREELAKLAEQGVFPQP